MSNDHLMNTNRILKSDRFLLSLIVAIFTVFYSFISWLRLANFFTTNWDLGIISQSLWTTTHGYIMYETTNYANSGAPSFLIVHSTFIAIPIAFFYSLYASPVFLLILQALIVSLSSIPLYLLSKEHIGNSRLSLLVVIVYLSSVAIISSILYDFHWEAFIPLEALSFFYFLDKGKLSRAFLVFIIGCATLEVFPFLAAGFILFDLSNKRKFSDLGFKDSVTRKAVILLFISALAYVGIRFIQKVLVPPLVGFTPSLGSVGSSTLLIFNVSFTGATLTSSLSYWMILYFSFLFVPVLYPKHFVAMLPWFFSSIFLDPSFSSHLGNQYAFVAIPGLITGFMFGVRELKTRWQNSYAITLALIISSVTLLALIPDGFIHLMNWHQYPDLSLAFWTFWILTAFIHLLLKRHSGKWKIVSGKIGSVIRSGRVKKYSIVGFAIIIVLTNFVLSPLSPNNFEATPMPGYQLKYSYTQESFHVSQMTSVIPENATVLASDNLFPFVANHANAFSLRWTAFNYSTLAVFPFNSINLPQYLFLSSSQIHLIPSFISNAVFTNHKYGLVSYIYQEKEYPGSIYLMELGYNGTASVVYNSGEITSIFLGYGNLSVGPNSSIQDHLGSRFGKVITGPVNGFNSRDPVIWYGPYYDLLPGEYKVTINMSGNPLSNQTNYSGPIVYLNSNTVGSPYYFSSYIDSSQLQIGHWTDFNYYINVTAPFPTEFRGYYIIDSSGVAPWIITLNYIQIQKA